MGFTEIKLTESVDGETRTVTVRVEKGDLNMLTLWETVIYPALCGFGFSEATIKDFLNNSFQE